MTAPDNPFFARAIANRLWAHYFGRGLVEPLDDMRTTNPATNRAAAGRAGQADARLEIRSEGVHAHAAQFAALPARPADHSGTPATSRTSRTSLPRAVPAEVLLDAISQATGVPEKFNGWPEGYRAIQVWDNRMPSYFFRIFGRPVRASVCECERSNEPSIAQALHLMNSEEIMSKIHDSPTAPRELAHSKMSPREIVDELYLGTLSRFPSDKERTLMLQVFAEAGDDRQAAVEDVLWALLNTREFVYNH